MQTNKVFKVSNIILIELNITCIGSFILFDIETMF